jgi:hypothetical protein
MFFQAWENQRNQPNAIGNIFDRSDIDSDFRPMFSLLGETIVEVAKP